MSLYEKIKTERADMRKSGDKLRYDLLTVLLGEIERVDSKAPSDELIQSILLKMIENAEYGQTVRYSTLVEQHILILRGYLPAYLEEDEIVRIAENHDHIGAFMGAVNRRAKFLGLLVDNTKARQIFENKKG